MNRTQARPEADVQVQLRGDVPPEAAAYARAKVATVVAQLHAPVLGVRVRLAQDAHPSAVRPARAEAVVDVNGRPVRAEVTAPTVVEAVDLLKDRLAARLGRLADRRVHHPHRKAPHPSATTRDA